MATILEGLNAISQAVGGTGGAESNLEALNQISEALGGSADATENAEAIANIAENASGGGGSSDFTTATVTVTGVVTQGGGMMPSVEVMLPHIYEGVDGTEFISFVKLLENNDVVDLTVVLYKGLAIAFSDNSTITNLSGDITFDEDTSSYQITGDCSFTVTDE